MSKAFSIAGVNLRRVFRDRVSLFFMVVFPFVIILMIGAMYGSSFEARLGVLSRGSGALGTDLVSRLERHEGIRVRAYEDRESLTTAVERGEVEAGLVIPSGYDTGVRAGETVSLPYIARPTGSGQDAQLIVAAAVDRQAVVLRAARFAASEGVGSFDEALRTARALDTAFPRVKVRSSIAGSSVLSFDYGAAQELLLFVFLVSLAAASMLIESRRLGVSRRMLASPTGAATVILGEGLGRFAIALFQGGLIVAVTLVVFGVDWGDPLATAAIVILFGLVGTGAAMLMGSTLGNAQQAGSFGVFFGLILAALGGCMVPLEIFPSTMRTIAHATPHAWALDAFGEVLGRNGTVAEIWPQLAALALYAAGLLSLAAILFRRKLTA
ncbi:MAG: ABC transporter permease [Actinomycetota bacterium]